MSTDTLITTIISTSSSIVSITGGFMVSRLIALSAEKNGFMAKMDELNAQIKQINLRLMEIEQYALNSDLERFFYSSYSSVIEKGAPLEELANDKNKNISNRTTEQLRETYNLIHKISADIRNHFCFQPDDQDFPSDFGDFIDKTRLKYDSSLRNYYENVYMCIEKQATEEMDAIERMAKYAPYRNRNFNLETVDNERLKAELREKEKLIDERDRKQSLIDLNFESMNRLGKPDGIISGLWFIVVSILLGILYPICWILVDPKYINNGIRASLFICFFIVVIYFILYLYHLINTLFIKKSIDDTKYLL